MLTPSMYAAKDAYQSAEFLALDALHEQTANLSLRGLNRVVPAIHHNLEVDQPQAIIDAVDEVPQQVHTPARDPVTLSGV